MVSELCNNNDCCKVVNKKRILYKHNYFRRNVLIQIRFLLKMNAAIKFCSRKMQTEIYVKWEITWLVGKTISPSVIFFLGTVWPSVIEPLSPFPMLSATFNSINKESKPPVTHPYLTWSLCWHTAIWIENMIHKHHLKVCWCNFWKTKRVM